MTTGKPRHFRIIFKRSQSAGPTPTFSLLVSAEMSDDFITAARYYGVWNDVVYADPKLSIARDMRARQSELQVNQNRRSTNAVLNNFRSSNIQVRIASYLTLQFMKLVYVLPFKLLWWVFAAVRTQQTQIVRLRELPVGRVVTTHTLTEIREAEESIQLAAETIEAYVYNALQFGGEAYEPRRQEK